MLGTNKRRNKKVRKVILSVQCLKLVKILQFCTQRCFKPVGTLFLLGSSCMYKGRKLDFNSVFTLGIQGKGTALKEEEQTLIIFIHQYCFCNFIINQALLNLLSPILFSAIVGLFWIILFPNKLERQLLQTWDGCEESEDKARRTGRMDVNGRTTRRCKKRAMIPWCRIWIDHYQQ